MSQSDFGNLESPLTGANFINNNLEPFRNALHTSHSGSSRPTYVQAGMIWLDTTTNPWIVKLFSGTVDIALGTANTSTNIFTPAGLSTGVFVGGTAGGTANALTVTCTPVVTAYANNVIYTTKIATTNTSGTVTVNVGTAGAISVRKFIGGAKVSLAVGDQQVGMIAIYSWDGTDLILTNPRSNSRGADIASASTLNLDTATGDYVTVTGTVTVTGITLQEGREVTVRFAGVLTLTNGANLKNVSGANIISAADDVAVFRGEASGVVRMVNYSRASGAALVAASGGWMSDLNTYRYYTEDFVGKLATEGYDATSGGTGSSSGINSSQSELYTGSTSTGTAVLMALIPIPSTKIGGLQYNALSSVQNLSDGTNRYTYRVGVGNSPLNGEVSHGIYFRYADNVNSGNYQCVCRSASVETVINTSIAPALWVYATQLFRNLRFEVNAGATSVEFFIDGASQGTIATNIPTVLMAYVGHGIAKSVGTATRLALMDSQSLRITR